METIGEYRDDLIKLEKSDLISYEDKLAKAREDCEVEFRENFLARMRENIETAHDIFRSLNKSLKDIYYGNDSYKFELSANRERKSLYDMITSDMNIAGDNLFSATFEEKYHEEMEDLFNKLADENLAETSAVRDLTDYRSYLDYDIMVENKNGGVQRFSKTYGEKSGGETQTPYYVAIAASFAQMYSYGEPDDYWKLLRVLDAVEKVDNEIYEREFSARVLGDSKAFEKMRSTVISILYEYGDYPDKECILGELNIIKNPGHVFFKGCGSLVLADQEIDLSLLAGDIAISSADLKNIDELCVTGKSVVTIENLTTFNSYKPDGELVLYLGGYHNSVKRDFIRRMYEQNPYVSYYHYGDIDAGGLYILKHLRARTGVDFKPLHMDIDTLREKADYVRPLTANDVARLKKLLLDEDTEFHELIKYMLAHNCKLEQETNL